MSNSQDRSPYESVLAVAFLLLLVQYFFFAERPKLLAVSIFFVLACLLSRRLAGWVAAGWDGLTRALGWVMNNVLLSVVFLVILTPLAWVYRRFGKNDFYKSRAPGESYFVTREHVFGKDDLENPW